MKTLLNDNRRCTVYVYYIKRFTLFFVDRKIPKKKKNVFSLFCIFTTLAIHCPEKLPAGGGTGRLDVDRVHPDGGSRDEEMGSKIITVKHACPTGATSRVVLRAVLRRTL